MNLYHFIGKCVKNNAKYTMTCENVSREEKMRRKFHKTTMRFISLVLSGMILVSANGFTVMAQSISVNVTCFGIAAVLQV